MSIRYYIWYSIKTVIKLSWPCGMLGGLYHVGYFKFLQLFLQGGQNLIFASMLVSYPFLYLWICGSCSRLFWNSIISKTIYDEDEDRDYTALTHELLTISTGNTLTQQLTLLGGIITTALSQK